MLGVYEVGSTVSWQCAGEPFQMLPGLATHAAAVVAVSVWQALATEHTAPQWLAMALWNQPCIIHSEWLHYTHDQCGWLLIVCPAASLDMQLCMTLLLQTGYVTRLTPDQGGWLQPGPASC